MDEDCGLVTVKNVTRFECVCSTDFCNDGTAMERYAEGNKLVISWRIVSLGFVLVFTFKSFIY